MNEETPEKITTAVKTKDTKRVEAGRRLAGLSKVARERKNQEKIEQVISDKDTLFTYQNIIAVIGISIGSAALFYELYPRKVVKAQEEPRHVVITKYTPVNTQLESFD